MDSFPALCDKLQAPHPLLQRIAVSSIFQRFAKNAAVLQSAAGKEALNRCITSQNACIVDQSVRELCAMAKSGALALGPAMQILQVSLDSVIATALVSVLVGGIGFICRLYVANHDENAGTFPVHPLLKALKSRKEAQSAILQQIRLIVLQSGGPSLQDRALHFVQPFLAYVLLEPSETVFARELYANMCVIASSCPRLGPSILQLLLQYTEARSLKSPEDLDFLLEAVHEMLDVLEELPEETDLAGRIMELLFGLCRESRACSFPSLPFISLIRRLSLLPSMSTELQNWDAHLASLSYLAAVAELEQEQLMILALAQSWIEFSGGLSVLFWIFPTLHLLASPSASIRNAAIRSLSRIDHAISGKKLSILKSSSCGSLEARAFQMLLTLWSEEESGTWISLTGLKENGNPAMEWLRKLSTSITRVDDSKQADAGFPMLLAMLATAMVFHPTPEVAVLAVRLLASLGRNHSIWGMSLIPVFLFCLKFHLSKTRRSAVVIALLNAFPDLCGHPATLPLSMHFLQPLIDCDRNMLIHSTAIRLIYKIWERTDRAYPYLQRALVHDNFSEVTSTTDLLLSKAISLRDVCSHDPDTGVDLILSVQACIESKLTVVQSLGLRSLSSLCADDAIDFYTAWKVIVNTFSPLPQDAAVAESFCMLLKHGALDAEANPEEAYSILKILWTFASSQEQHSATRSAAIQSLCAYEVELLKETMIVGRNQVDILFLEANTVAKSHAQNLVIKFLDYEHRTRQRATDGKVVMTRLIKLLEAIPSTYTANLASLRESPGAFLVFSKYRSREQTATTPKKVAQKALMEEAEGFKRHFSHAAENLSVSGDLIMALASFYSWSWFMPEWLKLEARLHNERAIEHIMKTCLTASEEGIPRVAENSMLALAAFSQCLNRAGSETCAVVAKYFNSRIAQCEQWSASMSLGIVTNALHPTDWALKAKAVRSLIQLVSQSEDAFIVGSAAVGLGFASQALLLTQSLTFDNEYRLLSDMLRCYMKLLAERCPDSVPAIQTLTVGGDFPLNEGQRDAAKNGSEFWSVVGLVWALGYSVTALSRAGKSDMVRAVTEAVISWIPECIGEMTTMSLATGASLVISTCVEVSDRLELLKTGTLELLLHRLGNIARQVIELPQSKRSSQPWLLHVFRASCVGCGGLLATVLQTGRHPLSLDSVKNLLDIFQRGYTELELSQYCFGAMLGFANALGARITSLYVPRAASVTEIQQEAGSVVTTPLLFSNTCEEMLRKMLQQIVTISHTSDDARLRRYAKWSLGILHTTWIRASREDALVKNGEKAARWSYQPSSLSSLPENSTLRLLCDWLSTIGVAKANVPCSHAVTVLRCLEEAPRLPLLDWGGVIRRIMQHREWFVEESHGEVRKQCIVLSLRHANQVPPLASVLDELYEFSRFCSADIALQLLLLDRLCDLRDVFSSSRLEQLLEDVVHVLGKVQNEGQARECRIHCWKGLERFWKIDTEPDKQQLLLALVETCVKRLATLSPARFFNNNDKEEVEADKLEWSAALDCLKHATQNQLLRIFPVNADDDLVKAAFARSRLAAMKILPLSALKGVRSWLLNQKLPGQWMLLTEVALAVKDVAFEEKLEWLLNSIDTAYVSKYPSAALHFVALLSSVWNPDAYFLSTNKASVLEDLPHCLGTLVTQKKWAQSAGAVTIKVFALAERLAELKTGFEESEPEELNRLCGVVRKAAICLRKQATGEMLVKLVLKEKTDY